MDVERAIDVRPSLESGWHRQVSRHLRLWRRFLIQAFIRDTHYRLHFFTTLGVGLVQLGVALVPIWLLFGYTHDIRGWSQADVVAVLGLYQIMTGLLAAFVAPNMARMTTYITRGELDIVLVRPVAAQFYLTFRWINLAELGNVATGTVILFLGLNRGHVRPSPATVSQSVLLVVTGLTLLTCAWSILSCLAFWAQSVEPISSVVNAVLEGGKYPSSFFPGAIRAFFTFVFPVAFATTLPVQALGGGIGWNRVAAGMALDVLAILLARLCWRRGLRTYASASS